LLKVVGKRATERGVKGAFSRGKKIGKDGGIGGPPITGKEDENPTAGWGR